MYNQNEINEVGVNKLAPNLFRIKFSFKHIDTITSSTTDWKMDEFGCN